MRMRFAVLAFAGVFVAACGGEMGEGTAETAADSMATEASADETAVAQVRSDYVEHFNAHHPTVVADLFADSAIALMADGGVHMGKPAITADLEATMAGSPTLTLTPLGTMVLGDWAVDEGDYSVTMTPEGGTAMTMTGAYLALQNRIAGAWKISNVVTNYSAPPPPDLPVGESPEGLPPEEGMMKDVLGEYAQHFNLGHANVAAGYFTEDASVAFSGMPRSSGRAAIEAALTQRIANGSPQITIHDVGSHDLADGWRADSGWFEITSTMEGATTTQHGTYFAIFRREADGAWKIHKLVTNSRVRPAAG